MPKLPSEKESSDLLNRMPPADLDAERAVLGVMLAYNDASAFALDSLRADDFYDSGHEKIFSAIKKIYERGENVNVATVGSEMKSSKTIDEIGGNTFLIALSVDAIKYIGSRFTELIKIVSGLGIKRRLIAPLAMAMNECYELGRSANGTIDNLQQAIYEILRLTKSGDPLSLREIFKREIEYIETVISGASLPGILTGFKKFDLHIGSIFPGDLFILAGVPSSGKTVFATNVGLNAAKNYSKKVLFVSMEMHEKKFAPRLISNQANVPHRVARLRDYRGDNARYFANIAQMVSGLSENFHAIMEGAMTPIEIKTKAKKHAITKGLDMLIVDHLHEMKPINSNDTEYVRATQGAEIMKEIGMDLKIPVILLSQLSRELNHRPDPRPRMSDLRGSGNIEAKADIVAMIFRPGMYDGSNSNEMELSLEKYRDDERRIFKFSLNGSLMRYEEVSDEPTTGNRYSESPF